MRKPTKVELAVIEEFGAITDELGHKAAMLMVQGKTAEQTRRILARQAQSATKENDHG